MEEVEVELGIEDWAKYPFLKEVGEHIRALDLTVEDFAQPEYSRVLDRARERIREAIEYRAVVDRVEEAEVDILSFPIALLIVKATGNEYLATIYSHAEAIRIERFLEREKNPIITYIFRTVFGIDPIEVREGWGLYRYDYKIKVKDYLKRAAHLHELEWKLVNRVVDGGYVYLKRHELIRLIREELKKIIHSRIKSLTPPKLPPKIQMCVDEVADLAPKPYRERAYTTTAPESYPPCVKHALNLLQTSRNLPHFGRFLLTTYLLGVGKSVDDIIQLYPKAPDFSERITRYQVEHIAGLRGGKVKYTCPSCKTVQTHGFCFKDESCGSIRNPLQYGRVRRGG